MKRIILIFNLAIISLGTNAQEFKVLPHYLSNYYGGGQYTDYNNNLQYIGIKSLNRISAYDLKDTSMVLDVAIPDTFTYQNKKYTYFFYVCSKQISIIGYEKKLIWLALKDLSTNTWGFDKFLLADISNGFKIIKFFDISVARCEHTSTFSPSNNAVYVGAQKKIYRINTNNLNIDSVSTHIINPKYGSTYSAFAIDDNRVIVSDHNNTLAVYDFESKKVLKDFNPRTGNVKEKGINLIEFSTNNNKIFIRIIGSGLGHEYKTYLITKNKFTDNKPRFSDDADYVEQKKIFFFATPYKIMPYIISESKKGSNKEISAMYIPEEGSLKPIPNLYVVDGDDFAIISNQLFFGNVKLAKYFSVKTENQIFPLKSQLEKFKISKSTLNDAIDIYNYFSKTKYGPTIFAAIDDYILQATDVDPKIKERFELLSQIENFKKEDNKLFKLYESWNTSNDTILKWYYAPVLALSIDSIKYSLIHKNIRKHTIDNKLDYLSGWKTKLSLPSTTKSETAKKLTADIASFERDTLLDLKNGMFSFQKEYYPEALAAFDRYLNSIRKPDPMVYWYMSLCHYYSKNYKKALESFNLLKAKYDPYLYKLYFPNIEQVMNYCNKPVGEPIIPVNESRKFIDLEHAYSKAYDFKDAKKIQRAIQIFDSTGLIFKEWGDIKKYEDSRMEIALCWLQLNFTKGDSLFRSYMPILEKMGERKLNFILTEYLEQEKHSKAIELLDEIVKFSKRPKESFNKQYAYVYADWGYGYNDKKKYRDGHKMFIKSLIHNPDQGILHSMIALMMIEGELYPFKSELLRDFHQAKALYLQPDLIKKYPDAFKKTLK